MNKTTIISQVATKVAEMEELLDVLLNSDVSENTKRTQKFQRQTAIHNLKVLQAIVEQSSNEEFELKGDIEKWYTSMITLTSERRAPSIILHEGDNILQVMQESNKTYDQIKKIAEKQGLKMVMDHFEKM